MSAVGELITANYAALRRYCFKLCNGNRADAEDLAQQTCYLVLRNGGYTDSGRQLNYLMLVAKNAMRTMHRKRKRTEEDPDEQKMLALAAPASQDDYIDLKDTVRAIKTLTKDHQDALLGCATRGITEYADVCGVNLGTIKSRNFRARRELRSALGE